MVVFHDSPPHTHTRTPMSTHTDAGSCFPTAVTSFIFSGETATWGDAPGVTLPGAGAPGGERRAGRTQEGDARLSFWAQRGRVSGSGGPAFSPLRPGLPGGSVLQGCGFSRASVRGSGGNARCKGSQRRGLCAPRRHRRRAPWPHALSRALAGAPRSLRSHLHPRARGPGRDPCPLTASLLSLLRLPSGFPSGCSRRLPSAPRRGEPGLLGSL